MEGERPFAVGALAIAKAHPGSGGGGRHPPGVNTSFAQWIKRRLEPGERYYLVSKGSNSEQVYQWFTYVLSPNLATTDPRQADWLIFYGDSAASSPYVQLIRVGAQRFEWGYSIAKVSHAS